MFDSRDYGPAVTLNDGKFYGVNVSWTEIISASYRCNLKDDPARRAMSQVRAISRWHRLTEHQTMKFTAPKTTYGDMSLDDIMSSNFECVRPQRHVA